MNDSFRQGVQGNRPSLRNVPRRVRNPFESGDSSEAFEGLDIRQNSGTEDDDQEEAEGPDEGGAEDNPVHQRQTRHHAD